MKRCIAAALAVIYLISATFMPVMAAESAENIYEEDLLIEESESVEEAATEADDIVTETDAAAVPDEEISDEYTDVAVPTDESSPAEPDAYDESSISDDSAAEVLPDDTESAAEVTDTPAEEFTGASEVTETATVTSAAWSKCNIPTGYYMIQSKLSSKRYLEVASDSWSSGGNIQLGPTCTTASRVFYITNLGKGRFRIQACVSGHYMEVLFNTMAAGTNIRQGSASTGAKQIFYMSTNKTDGYYFIKPSQDIHNYCVGVKGGSTKLGTNIYLTKANYSYKAQQFKFIPVSAPNVEVNEGAYQIAFANNINYVASIPAQNSVENSTATLYKNSSTNYQKFNIIPLGDGYYKILVAANQLAISIKGGKSGNNIDIVQRPYKGYDSQKWKIVGCRGKFKFVSKLTGKAITTQKVNGYNLNNLRTYTEAGSFNCLQKFELKPTTVQSSATRGYLYLTDPATKKSFKLEAQFETDPYVSDTDFLAAVLYTEAGDQGIAGMMMVAYVIKTRMAEGIAAAKAGDYVEYPGTLKYMIYHYGQWQVARDGALTRVLTDITVGEASYLTNARKAASYANANKDITLEAAATRYVKKTSTTSTKTTLAKGTKVKASAFIYNSFMTPTAWTRYATSGSYPKFASGYGNGKNMFLYKGHVFFLDAEVW